MDICDEADRQQQVLLDAAINAHKNRANEQPEFNDDGDRVCLDCDAIIPLARVYAVNAVSCVGCAELEERSR